MARREEAHGAGSRLGSSGTRGEAAGDGSGCGEGFGFVFFFGWGGGVCFRVSFLFGGRGGLFVLKKGQERMGFCPP